MNETRPNGVEAKLLQMARAVQATGYAFTTPTPATHARVNARPSSAWAQDLAGVFGWSRPFREDVVPAEILGLMQEAEVLHIGDVGLRSAVRLSSLNDLLFVHSAYPTTAADSVFFGPDTYRFARAILAHLKGGVPVRRAVDVGCGAGPGATLLARAHPGAEVLAVDINPSALRMTRVNAALAGVQVAAVDSNLLSAIPGSFDLIVSNPPYLVDPDARAYRHGGGPLGAGLSLAILNAALERLAPGGTLLLYTGAAIVNGTDPLKMAAIAQIGGSGASWTYEELDPDVFGEELGGGAYAAADRIAAVVLTVKKWE
jgi:SAM-dependent methyltransferase